jgi:tight adherence protein B
MDWVIMLLMFLTAGLGAYGTFSIIQEKYGSYEKKATALAAGQLKEMFIFMSPKMLLYFKLGAVVALAAVGFFLTGSLMYAVIFAGLGYGVPQTVIWWTQKKRLEKFEAQLPEAMQNISNGMKAGFTIVQGIENMVGEMQPPISQEFGLAMREYRLGAQLDDALVNLVRRVKSPDLRLVVTSVNITRRMGGNLPEMLEKISFTIRERRRIEGKNKALTAQGKLQGIVVGSLPIALGGAFYLLDPRMMSYMWNTGIGLVLLFIMGVMEVLGFLFIRKIINIDV